MAKKVSIDVVLLAAGYKASREGKDRIIATGEMLEILPKMGYEVDRSGESLEKTQTLDLERLSVE